MWGWIIAAWVVLSFPAAVITGKWIKGRFSDEE